jgi:glutathione S-transferase
VGIITTDNQDVQRWQGVHLLHYGVSQCSQRVRLALSEKGVPWISHPIDLTRGENTTDWYQSINPNAVVPTLVHDGVVIIESTDIIEYIDQRFSGPALTPDDEATRALIVDWLRLSNDCKPAIRLLSFEFLFKQGVRMPARRLENYRNQVKYNHDLVAFREQFSRGKFSRRDFCDAASVFHEALLRIERQLSRTRYLAADEFTLADISWVGDLHRLDLMKFPIDRYPRAARWFRTCRDRKSFAEAITAWEPRFIGLAVRAYSGLRTALGTGVDRCLA